MTPYVEDLARVLDMEAIASSGLKIGADPMGGAGVAYWEPIADRYGLDIEVVNPVLDPTFSFMTLDRDGKIRMDCSSPYAMASLVGLKDRFDIAFGNDPDFDRHGVVTKTSGLMRPQSLPVRRDRIPVPTSPALARNRSDRQDPRIQFHD